MKIFLNNARVVPLSPFRRCKGQVVHYLNICSNTCVLKKFYGQDL